MMEQKALGHSTGYQAALIPIVIHDGSPKPGILGVPDLLLEAARTPGDQQDAHPCRPSADGVGVPDRRAGIDGFRHVQSSAHSGAIDGRS